MDPRIVLIHATPVAIEPVAAAFARHWPEADTVNLLEDSLSRDLERAGRLDEAMVGRFCALADYAVAIGADGILFTCSAFGPAIEGAATGRDMPVLKPNEAMFEAALTHGRRIGLLATFGPSVPSLVEELRQMAPGAVLEPVLVEGAMAALRAGDGAGHDRLIAEAAARLAPCDAVLLAQFSMARAALAVAAVTPHPVLTSPESAVAKLKAALSG